MYKCTTRRIEKIQEWDLTLHKPYCMHQAGQMYDGI
jgi:hypothetical protein